MKKIVVVLLFITGTVFSQNLKELKEAAFDDAQKLSDASMQQDVNTVLMYTHPLIEKKYGTVKLKETIEDIFRTMKAQRIKIKSSTIDEISEIKKEKGEFRCLAKNTVKMDFNGRAITLKSSLFGFYNKKKGYWHFVESNKLLNDPETKELFKNFKTEISIPEDEQIAEN